MIGFRGEEGPQQSRRGLAFPWAGFSPIGLNPSFPGFVHRQKAILGVFANEGDKRIGIRMDVLASEIKKPSRRVLS